MFEKEIPLWAVITMVVVATVFGSVMFEKGRANTPVAKDNVLFLDCLKIIAPTNATAEQIDACEKASIIKGAK